MDKNINLQMNEIINGFNQEALKKREIETELNDSKILLKQVRESQWERFIGIIMPYIRFFQKTQFADNLVIAFPRFDGWKVPADDYIIAFNVINQGDETRLNVNLVDKSVDSSLFHHTASVNVFSAPINDFDAEPIPYKIIEMTWESDILEWLGSLLGRFLKNAENNEEMISKSIIKSAKKELSSRRRDNAILAQKLENIKTMIEEEHAYGTI